MRTGLRFAVTLALVLLAAAGRLDSQPTIDPLGPFDRVIPPRTGGSGQNAPPAQPYDHNPAGGGSPLQPGQQLWPHAVCLMQTGAWCLGGRLQTEQELQSAYSLMGYACSCNGVGGRWGLTKILE